MRLLAIVLAFGAVFTAAGCASDPKERADAMLIQSIAAEESGDKALASVDALEGVMKVQAIRKDHGLAPTCT